MGLIADVFKVLVVDADDNVLATDTLQDANIEVETESNDVNGGQGNGLIAILHGRKDINISLTDPVWKMENLALHLGQNIVTGVGVAYAMPTWKTVSDNVGSLEITLENEPKAGTLKMYMEDGTEISGFTIEADKVTISDVVVEAGDKIEVRTYQYDTNATAETLEIDDTKFPKDAKIILETLEISEDEQPVAKLQYQFDRVKPSASFSVSTSSSREASNTESSFRVLKPKTSNVVGRLIRIPIETP